MLHGFTPKVIVRDGSCEQYAYRPPRLAKPGNRIPPILVIKIAVAHGNRYLIELDQAQGQISIVRPKQRPTFLRGNVLECVPVFGVLRQSQQFQGWSLPVLLSIGWRSLERNRRKIPDT